MPMALSIILALMLSGVSSSVSTATGCLSVSTRSSFKAPLQLVTFSVVGMGVAVAVIPSCSVWTVSIDLKYCSSQHWRNVESIS